MCLCISWFWKQRSNIIIRIYILTMIETVSCPLFLHSYGRQGCDGLKIAKVRLTFSSFNAMPAAEIIKKKWLLVPYEIDLKLQYLGDIKPKRTIKYTNIYFISWYLWTMRRQNPNLVPLKTVTLLNQPSFHKHMRNFFSDFVGLIWGQQLAILLGKWLHFVPQRSCRIGTCLNIRLILFKHLFFLFLLNQSWRCHTVTFAMLLLLLFLLLYY